MNFHQVVTLEASFPYVDAGATCSDTVAGDLADVIVHNTVDVDRTGEYLVTYRARDAAGNWNDGDCRGTNRYIRTVYVVDTLQPVISLHETMGKGDLRNTRRLLGEKLFRTAAKNQSLWVSTGGLAIAGGLCMSLLLLHIFATRRRRKAQQPSFAAV
jgi:hypothetical protein